MVIMMKIFVLFCLLKCLLYSLYARNTKINKLLDKLIRAAPLYLTTTGFQCADVGYASSREAP